jgi:hypothetical protein
MNRDICFRCDALLGMILGAIGRHVNLLGSRRVAQVRLDADAVAELDVLIEAAAQERDEVFRQYLAHLQMDEHPERAKHDPVLLGLIPAPENG